MKSLDGSTWSSGKILKVVSVPLIYNFFTLGNLLCVSLTFHYLELSDVLSFQDRIIFLTTFSLCTQLCNSMMMMIMIGFYILQSVNDFIENFIGDESDKVSASLESTLKTLSTVTKIYDKVCDAFESISTFYTPVCLIFLSILTFFEVLAVYTCFVFLKIGGYQMACFLITTLLWATAYLPFVLCIIAYASATQTECLTTADLVQKLSNKTNNDEVIKLSKSLMLLVSHRRPTICCGFFQVNWELFFGIIACVFSFSLIVIQFSDI